MVFVKNITRCVIELSDLVHPGTVHLIQGDVEDPYAECRRLSATISAETIDVAFVMSIQQIMKAQAIICTVPDQRKAEAVKQCPEGGISPWHPASILRRHPNTSLYLDTESAFLLQKGKEI